MNYTINKLKIIKKIRFPIKASFIIFIIIFNHLCFYTSKDLLFFLKPFENYINACKHSRNIIRDKIFKNPPYISICLAALNIKR